MELCCSVIETYGAYLLDHENEHIVKAYVHQTQDDEAARKEARKYLDGHDIEIWDATLSALLGEDTDHHDRKECRDGPPTDGI